MDKKEDDYMFKIALGAGRLGTAGKRCLKPLDPNETREWRLNDRIRDKIESALMAYADLDADIYISEEEQNEQK